MRIEPGHSFEAGRAAEKNSPPIPREPSVKTPARLSSGFKSPLESLDELAQWQTGEDAEQGPEARWPAEKMPLGIWVDSNDLITSEAALAVMRQWEAASNGQIRFELRLAEPDIKIGWTETPVPGRDFEVGHTDVKTASAQRIQQVTITLLTQPAIDRQLDAAARRNRLAATILHETGHALGLRHSEHRQDVMHHRGWQRLYLSENDIRRIQELYKPRTQVF